MTHWRAPVHVREAGKYYVRVTVPAVDEKYWFLRRREELPSKLVNKVDRSSVVYTYALVHIGSRVPETTSIKDWEA